MKVQAYFSWVCIGFIPRNWRIWLLLEAGQISFLAPFWVPESFSFFNFSVFYGHRGSRLRHLRLFSASLPGQPPLCRATLLMPASLSAAEKVIKKLFCDDFNLSPLTPPEFRVELPTCPVLIPRVRRSLFIAPEWQDPGSAASPKAQPGQQCPLLPTVGRMGFSSSPSIT